MTSPMDLTLGALSTNGHAGPGPDDRLSVIVERPDGTQIRWGEDELAAANIPLDLSFGSSMPGGFKGLQTTLLRDIGVTSREGMFDDVRVLGPGGVVVWEGRLQQMPVSTDQGGRVTPQAVGWAAHLDDDATFREIYVDRELSSWGSQPSRRRQKKLSNPLSPFDGGTAWGSNDGGAVGPVLTLLVSRIPPWQSAAGRPDIASVYPGGGIDLGAVEFRYASLQNLDSSWRQCVVGMTSLDGDADTGFSELTGQQLAPNSLRFWSAPAGTKLLEIELTYVNWPAGNSDAEYGMSVAEVAVYGRHNLSGVRGPSYTGAGEGPYGYRASEVIPDVLRRAAPLLTFTTGPDGSIRPTDYPIPHLVFRDPVTATDPIERLNAFHQWDWGVWEDRRFWWTPRGAQGRTWRIATADGLDLSLEGDTTDAIYNGVLVTYTDFAGVSRTVGPPGTSAEATDARLESTDPTNPATVHGIRRRGVLQLSTATDQEGATVIGQAWLNAQATATRRGSATVYGWVTDEHGTLHPVSRVRAGDTLIVEDRPDDPPRRIVETNYSHTARTNALTLDNSAATLEAILERMGVALVGRL